MVHLSEDAALGQNYLYSYGAAMTILIHPFPFRSIVLHLTDVSPQVLAQPLMGHRPAKSFNIGILFRFARLKTLQCNVLLLSICLQLVTEAFRTIVTVQCHRLSPPLHGVL